MGKMAIGCPIHRFWRFDVYPLKIVAMLLSYRSSGFWSAFYVSDLCFQHHVYNRQDFTSQGNDRFLLTTTGGQFPKRTDRPDFRHFVATHASHNAVLHVDFLCVCVYFFASALVVSRGNACPRGQMSAVGNCSMSTPISAMMALPSHRLRPEWFE